MEDRSIQVFSVALVFILLAWITVGLRVYVRGFMLRAFALDDWLIVLTLGFYSAYATCVFGGVAYGTGKHTYDLTPYNAQKAMHFWWFCELFYILSTSFMKLSVGALLLRSSTKRMHIWIIRFIMLFTTLFGGAYFLLAIFQCKPISAWWKINSSHGSCMGPAIVLGTSYASAALNSIADWTFGILPYFIVKDLRLPSNQKVLIAMILGFAAIGSLATLIRMPFIVNLTRTDDFLYATVDIAIWSTVEPGVGIAAACAATLRPLLQRLFRGRPGWFSRPKGYAMYTSRRGGPKRSQSTRSYIISQPHSMPILRPDYVGNYAEIKSFAEKSYCPAEREDQEHSRSSTMLMHGRTSSRDHLTSKSAINTAIMEVTSPLCGVSSTDDDITALPRWDDSQRSLKLPSKPTKIFASQDQRQFFGLCSRQKGVAVDGAGLESMGIMKSVEVTFAEEIDFDLTDRMGKSLEDGLLEQENGRLNVT
ncbi:Kinesin heavy chain [Venturia nashicola]|uniref:Kinesin heavy chain n=1 Tax=Venturia nashicola TaxID=86259 RepID=A0A4Z1NXY7_9PEZI|nr:Kinesin heavy chain [Venturia nashicola]